MVRQAGKNPDRDKKFARKKGVFFFYQRIFMYFKKYFKLAVSATLVTVAMIAYTSMIPLIIKAIFDDALAHKDIHLFLILFLFYLF